MPSIERRPCPDRFERRPQFGRLLITLSGFLLETALDHRAQLCGTCDGSGRGA